ncbi:MAG: FadR family transcriptional regulator [Lachnospiraceae bacterium]|jgi:GntR family transcriptional repressor for pyruvate dehydrogenase complex|nr:FadR family transcriptional regulator [Lachnospiraceae bacterium]
MGSRKQISIVQQTVEQIKKILFTSGLEKGQHLPSEKELCESIGVSRNSLREALRILAATGYITLEPGRGAFALRTKEFDEDEDVITWFAQNEVEVQDYLEIRSACEPLAAKLAIERCSSKDLERLHAIHAAFLKAVESGDKQEIVIQEGKFHDTIIELSQNKLLISLFKIMRSRTIDFRYQSLRLPNAPQDAILPHSRIMRAFDLHDGDLGESAMREHIKLGIYNYRIAMIDAELEGGTPST